MLAQDVPPSRLGRAKADVDALVNRLEGERVGLIAFAGVGFLALAGSKSALGLLIVIVFGVFVISVGGRLRA